MERTNYKGNPNLKPAAVTHSYDEEQIAEFHQKKVIP